ncbi:MAG: palmitoyltransferase for Vac8p [Claussenomyces sp. TS43310]|nr:MAG: palmitoyltransferase for Vac8p [Claussenomyces sp. TS43310]
MQHQHIVDHDGIHTPTFVQRLQDVHTNALPGVTRPEEGEAVVPVDRPIHGQPRTLQSYDALERFRARERYEAYLEEQDSEKLPNAFDLGWRKNLLHLFGVQPALWFFPIYTTTGDGWKWEPSPKWLNARDQIRAEREAQQQRERAAGWGLEAPWEDQRHAAVAGRSPAIARNYLSSHAPSIDGRRTSSKADRILGRDPSQYADEPDPYTGGVSLHTLKPRQQQLDEDDYESSSDELVARERETDRRTGNGWSASGLLGKLPKPKEGVVKNHWGDRMDDDGVD